MNTRAEQREQTRERIVEAAVESFAERGFRGASTREIARRAGTNQGLITYHFQTKEALWRAAADRLFGLFEKRLAERVGTLETADPRERAREAVRVYVRFAAEHPELFRFMLDKDSEKERTSWLVDTHLAPLYALFPDVEGADGDLKSHAYYVLVGAGSVMFAVPDECRRLTGLDPESEPAIEAHAEYVARLLIP